MNTKTTTTANFSNLNEYGQRVLLRVLSGDERYLSSAATNLARLTKTVLLESIPDPEEYGYTVAAPVKTDAEKVLFTVDTFAQEFCAHRKDRRFSRLFNEWMQGLPFCAVPFMNYDIIEMGKKWGVPMKSEDEESAFISVYWESLGPAIQALYREHRPKGSRVLFSDYMCDKVWSIEAAYEQRMKAK